MEIKDIITIIGVLFSIAVAIKTLFFSSSKPTINIEGNNNTAKIKNEKNTTNISKTTKTVIIPPKNSNNNSNSSENEVVLMLLRILCFIIGIVFILTFNTYIVAILSVLIVISLLLNVARTKKYRLTSQEIFFVIIEHVFLSIIVLFALYMPEQLKNLLGQFKPFNVNGFSFFIDWLTDSVKIILSSLNKDEMFNVGIVLLLRIVGTVFLTSLILNKFPKKTFIRKIQNFRENSKSSYFSLALSCFFILLLLQSSFLYYPLKDLLSPIMESIRDSISIWFNK
ncbi:hypothetical protein [Oceanobacillus sp. CFH 90083]|uniref:hypothetical protein n=1 Tax=Oceanobacillus sp. CFH 90083 TaxID=2592336 RepID=UPI00128AE627|nr:hypothetical protein [Oceanobacillus sp. CFH 90083]